MKIRIDRNDCTSCSTCWEMCPGFFGMNPDDSLSQVAEPFRENGDISRGIPPEDLEACAREAADSCPVQVIHVEE